MFLSTLNNHDQNTLLSLSYWFVACIMVPDFPMMVEEGGRVQEILSLYVFHQGVCHLYLYTTALNICLA